MRVGPARLCLLVAVLATPLEALAQTTDDYAFEGGGWSSVSTFMRVAREQHRGIQTPERLDVGTLTPADSLLILYPREPLPAGALTSFLRAGGRIALADDFGRSDDLLRVFRIARGHPTTETAMRLRGNPELLVARPSAGERHRLTEGVTALVANHPQMVVHRELAPLFELNPGEALVLAGAVGEGRLVVIGDPSVLIDNMMTLRGNRRFAGNLVDYLEDDRGGRLFVMAPDARLVGRYGEPGADRPLHDLRRSLEALASVDVPPPAVTIGSLALVMVAALFAFGSLPRQSPYRAGRMFARPPAHGGFVGRVGYFGRNQRKANLLPPMLVYKFELEAAILERLGLSERALLRDVLKGMRDRGIGEHDVKAMRALLLELDRLRDLADRPPAPPHVSARRFRAAVSEGDRLLSLMGDA